REKHPETTNQPLNSRPQPVVDGRFIGGDPLPCQHPSKTDLFSPIRAVDDALQRTRKTVALQQFVRVIFSTGA
ncbi:hypothetical protein, partial [Aquabacter sediminis]|uniref:hypothetical protein n=1 Tax=Aquabacter sediminis TaxID=3029197 RepID=UPI00237D9D43